jgi:hypothetical protein
LKSLRAPPISSNLDTRRASSFSTDCVLLILKA